MKEDRRIKKNLKDGTENFWWLRSAYSYYKSYVVSINTTGDMSYSYNDMGYGISPTFII